MADELLDGPISTRITAAEKAELIANAGAIGSSKDIVLRQLIRAFNDACREGRKPVFPLRIASPMYRVKQGRVEDATVYAIDEPQVATAAEHSTTKPTLQSKIEASLKRAESRSSNQAKDRGAGGAARVSP
jgi:hypothetical protein